MSPRAVPAPLWLADWSDSEDEDFRAACRSGGVEPRVLRARPLGPTVGTPLHRLRSWPAYLGLAVRGLARADGAPLVAWQPLAGALAGLLRPGRRPPLVVLNPLIDEAHRSLRRRTLLQGLRRAERVLFFTRGGVETGAHLGLDRERLRFVPLGVRARRESPAPPGGYLLAAGREDRDWRTLARAAEGLDVEVRVVGPRSLPEPGPLRLEPPVDRAGFLALLEGARALVLPLHHSSRPAGQLTLLDAMSVGRAAVATLAPGTADYVAEETGLLVPPGDAEALRSALVRVSAPGVAEALGAAALAAARGPLSLERFVCDVDAEARQA